MALSAMAEGKDVKLEGEGQCAKCSLGIADKCEKSKAFHKNLCQGVKKTNVAGTWETKDDKLVVTVTEIELVK